MCAVTTAHMHRAAIDRHSRSIMASMRSAAAALLLLAVTAQAVHLDFTKGLNGWIHSETDK